MRRYVPFRDRHSVSYMPLAMNLRKWRTNSSELNQRLKNLNFEVDEHKESLNTLIASKVLGVGWNEKSDTFYFDSSDLGTFLSKRINTKRYLLQAAGRLFDPLGFIGPYTIRIKCLIQEIWCLGLDWDDKLPKQLEVSWNKWCNEIHYLSEIKIPRYYFQNFLPSNATTIQLHCFSDASKKAYGTVAYLRIELNNGNIISSFVASKGRVAPLKTLSIPRLELMGALLSASTKATHLEVVSDLTTEAFLACLRRFIARRSKPSVIWSDNATNFKEQETFLMKGTKFASPTEFNYSARKRESNGTSFHPLLPISVDCGRSKH
ncbi:uncharacterized protein TNCV_4104061 [Trichonephila clavipes]|nr:uncharacterized protein TNCV_4104061 [Trichonephila clavipes]